MTIRKVLIEDSELRKIEEDREKWLQKNLETGGYVFGKVYPNGLALVTRVIDGGPKAERTPVSFSGDNEHATQVKEELQKEEPETRLLGEYHVHPWKGAPNPSGGDINQLREAKTKRPWFVIFLSTEDGFQIWNLIEDDDSPKPSDWGQWTLNPSITKPVPLQVVGAEATDEEKLLDRILKTTRHELLMQRTALVVGTGSGGSVIAKYLGCTGLGRIILIDKEELEVPNIIRHEGGIGDLGKPKAEICKEIIESHNPFTVVESYDLDVTGHSEELQRIAREADLIIGASGSVRINNILNGLSIKMKKPSLYGGAFEKGRGGLVLAVRPFEGPCFNCIFGLASQLYSVDKESAQSYGLNEDELHQQQGLWIDVSFPALVLAKMAVAMLQDTELDYNLVVYDNDLEIRKLKAKRRDDCAVCNFEGWRRAQLKQSVFSKARQWLTRTRADGL